MKSNNKLKTFWLKWKKIAQRAGNFQARVVLTVFYFIFIAPVGIIFRLFSDPLRTKVKGVSNWLPFKERKGVIEEAEQQF